MEYYSCPSIDNMHLNFYGRIDKDEPTVALCCESDSIKVPGIPLKGDAEGILNAFIALHNNVINVGKHIYEGGGTRVLYRL